MASRVLVVEKEPVVRELLCELLSETDRTVLPAATAAQALEIFRARGPIEVALIEKELPDRGGLQLVQELKRLDAGVEIILMSTSASFHAVLEAVDAGASDYLPKPFEDINQVAIRVTSAEEQAMLRRERQRLHHELVESEERYRKLFAATPDAVVVIDEGSGIVADCNAAALALYGYSRDEFLGLRSSRLSRRGSESIPPASRLSPDAPAGVIRRRDLTSSGEGIDVELVSGRFQTRGRNMVVEIVRDIGERLAAERAKAELEEQLRQSQKMEALGRLAGGIAHDFNNLLTVILNYASFAAKRLRKNPDAEGLRTVGDDVEQILQAATSATAVTRQLLAFSRRDVVHPEVLSVNDVVVAIEKLLRRTMGDRIELGVELDPDLRPVEIDRGQLEQVIINLAVNARDAMPGGGRLTIATRTEHTASGDSADVPAGGPADWVVIEVADTGVGMLPTVAEKVFEPFFTTKERGKGTGIGLATVKGIVDRAGGTIELDTELGSGTKFSIRLPVSALPIHALTAASVGAGGAPRGESVLVVDDDDAVRRAICRILTGEGYAVSEARDGPEALLAHERLGGRLHLLLTDVVMPGMSGEELARELRQRQPDLKIVYTTGYATTTVIELGSEKEQRVVLPKPFREERLLALVRETLDRVPAS